MSAETLEALNINTLIGFTSKRDKAWHYRDIMQGDEPNHYEGAVPIDDVRRRLLAWDAVEGSLTATHLSTEGVLSTEAADFKAIMRSDTGAILGIHSSGYQIHDYKQWLLTNVENLLDANLQIGSAGLLNEGRKAWVQIEMPETMEAVEGVHFRPFLTAATSHDGSLSTTYLTGAQVVVCDNTLSVALGEADESFKVRHSSRSLSRLTDVRAALGVVYQAGDQFKAQVKRLVETPVSDEAWKAFVATLTNPGPNASARSKTMAQQKVADIVQLWNYDERVAPWKGTAYGVLAAVNTWEHHGKTVRNATRAERNMARAITGEFDKLDSSTLQLLAKVS